MRDFARTKRNSCERYAGLTLTSTRPERAHAKCSRIHSAQLLAHTPTRSPGCRPRPASPRAVRSTSVASAAHVSRTSRRTTSASRLGNRWAVSRRTSVVVFSRRGSAGPWVWLNVTGCMPGAAIEDTGLQFTSVHRTSGRADRRVLNGLGETAPLRSRLGNSGVDPQGLPSCNRQGAVSVKSQNG